MYYYDFMKTVLLVEDDVLVRKFLSTVITDVNADISCISCDCFDVSKEILKSNVIDAIVLDLFLPDCDGLPTYCLMKQFAGDIPVIVVTAAEDRNIHEAALNCGVFDFLQKTDEELFSKLRDSLQRAFNFSTCADKTMKVSSAYLTENAYNSRQLIEHCLPLSSREGEVLSMMLSGIKPKAIAGRLKIAPQTVSTHIKNIYKKTRTRNIIELTRLLGNC